ncbi:hypothetical protein Nepgr_005936 [Nepenthes gracilis]|uniref:protein-serine/threonine phosphatase n=1 Tax=Nepenthes gracilis TaxID=150966 RepID=A0AAD3S4J9_NEPGR|nr:hypothetical protein Nepgr_005936 [Nepenthes gracilis]
MPFGIGNFVSDDEAMIAGLMLKENSASLLSDISVERLPLGTSKTSCCNNLAAGFSTVTDSLCEKNICEELTSSTVTSGKQSCHVNGSNNERETIEADCFPCCQSMAGENSSSNGEESSAGDANSVSNLPTYMGIEKNGKDLKAVTQFITWDSKDELEPVGDVFAVAEDLDVEEGNGHDLNASSVLLGKPQEKIIRTMSSQCGFCKDSKPLWGFTSICGGRPEMEDAIAAIPCFQRLPTKMFMSEHESNGLDQNLTQAVNFYGVYDGHGGCQVANYCRDRLHLALAEEIETLKREFQNGCIANNWQEQWEKAFYRCFLKVDAEVGGSQQGNMEGNGSVPETDLEPIAPETVGSTAVVAVVCSSHIIVANSGDSRAVLCRGKTPMPLSIDHKPNRKDEWERIEAADGKVIQWNGFRVFGVLAMSRSIGDRYMKPWIIPDPEVMFVPRAKDDDCLILASDGLWDVMSNEEACEAARRRILLWHKRKGANMARHRDDGVDPAAQSAAEYLSRLALQRGSKDNVSVIVVDLKPHRKLKTKT